MGADPDRRRRPAELIRGPALATVVVALVAALAGCGTSATPLPIPSGALVVRAVDLTFQPADLTAPSAQGFTLYFENADKVPHNIVLLAADGSRAFSADAFTGVGQRVYEVQPLAPGSYRMHCDVHPDMTGTLTVP